MELKLTETITLHSPSVSFGSTGKNNAISDCIQGNEPLSDKVKDFIKGYKYNLDCADRSHYMTLTIMEKSTSDREDDSIDDLSVAIGTYKTGIEVSWHMDQELIDEYNLTQYNDVVIEFYKANLTMVIAEAKQKYINYIRNKFALTMEFLNSINGVINEN